MLFPSPKVHKANFVAKKRSRLQVTCPKGRLSEGSFLRNGVVQFPKFDAKPNPIPNSNPNPNPNSNPNSNPTLCLYVSDKWPFGQVSELHVPNEYANQTTNDRSFNGQYSWTNWLSQ